MATQIENVQTKQVVLPASVTSRMQHTTGFVSPDPNQLRVVIIGRPGCGKSAFVSSNPKAILFDLENNSYTVPDPAAQRLNIKTASASPADDIRESVNAILRQAKTDKALRESISTFAFDSFDVLVEIFLRDLCTKNGLEDAGDYGGGHGRGYFKVRDEIFDMLNRIRIAGFGWVLTAHLSLVETKQGSGVWVPKLNVSKTFRDTLVRSRDLTLRMDIVRGKPSKDDKAAGYEKMYVLKTETSAHAEDADGPKSNVPMDAKLVIPEINGWATFEDAYRRATEIRRKKIESGVTVSAPVKAASSKEDTVTQTKKGTVKNGNRN
jgi:hypothetical protein